MIYSFVRCVTIWRVREGNAFYHIRLKHKTIYLSYVSAEAFCHVCKLRLKDPFPLPPLEPASVFHSCLCKLPKTHSFVGQTWQYGSKNKAQLCLPAS